MHNELQTSHPNRTIPDLRVKKTGQTQRQIAKVLKRSESTISRELSRNTGGRGYRPKQAYKKSEERRAINAWRIDEDELPGRY